MRPKETTHSGAAKAENGEATAHTLYEIANWAVNKNEELAEVLRFELEFLRSGGYQGQMRSPDLPSPVFRKSPICLNYLYPHKEYSCSSCALFELVPENRRREAVPCHFIPLNARGDTVDSLGYGSQAEVEEAVSEWIESVLRQRRGGDRRSGSARKSA